MVIFNLLCATNPLKKTGFSGALQKLFFFGAQKKNKILTSNLQISTTPRAAPEKEIIKKITK